jgi:signal transduction histidine kinase
MKITTRIISGYGIFIAILAGLVIYQIITIRRMQATSRTLSGINFQNAITSLTASSDLEGVEDITRKSIVSADPRYRDQLQEYQEAFHRGLMELKAHAASGEEQTEINRLLQQWQAYLADLAVLQQGPPQEASQLPPDLQRDLEELKSQTGTVYQVTLRGMSSQVEASRKAGETAVLVLWCATGVAFAASILVSLLIVRSISKPLANLTEGTRAIADGKFFYRLDTSRNDEFSQLARDFNKMTIRLNELDELKKDFVSHVSHELKAPLASMRETTQLMLEQIPGPLTDKQKRLLELNLQSGTRLTSMISNLLDISKTEAGAMEYELKSGDLVPLARNAIAELEVQAHDKKIEIRAVFPQDPLPVACDSDRIVQVLLNLIGNAVKFSPRLSEVFVLIEKVEQIPATTPEHWRRLIKNYPPAGHYALVTVEDSGPGIPDTDKERVFEKFHQVKQEKKLPGQGAGLGLSICRTIIQAHRGAIWVEDNPGGGSRLKVLLRGGDSSGDTNSSTERG